MEGGIETLHAAHQVALDSPAVGGQHGALPAQARLRWARHGLGVPGGEGQRPVGQAQVHVVSQGKLVKNDSLHCVASGQVRSGQVRVFNVHIQSKLL